MIVSIDFETRSTVDLKKSGVYVYAEHPTTDVWCMAWAIDDGEPDIWRLGDPFPPLLRNALCADGAELRAWNANFERVIWDRLCGPRYGWHREFGRVPMERWYCTAADAAAMALPRTLGVCAKVLGIEHQIDDAKWRHTIRMSRPRSTKGGKIVWWDVPDRLERLYDDCKQDVRMERDVYRATRRLSESERQIYLLDQRINDRGVLVDVPLVRAAQGIVQEGLERANADIRDITGGAVSGVTKVADIKMWLGEQGLFVPSLRKTAVRDILEGELPDPARVVIEARAEAGRSSVAKLEAMQRARCADDRARGLLLYHGAGTGRWAGKLIQPQNFPRPVMKRPEQYIEHVLAGAYDVIDLFAPPLAVIASLLRAMFRASPGCRLLVVDFAQIEARVLNWLAGQDDIVEAFRNKDPIYERMAEVVYRLPRGTVTKEDPRRQDGKNVELGCGFGMGAGREDKDGTLHGFRKYVKEQTGVDQGQEFAEQAVQAYRDTHLSVVELWGDLGAAAFEAVRMPGAITRVKGCTFVVRSNYLWLKLPSGRFLCYARPRIRPRKTPWGEWRESVVAEGVDSFTKRWYSYPLYGGLITENIVQALSRDLMAEAMLRQDAAGYPLVLSVHDEIVADAPSGSLQEFMALAREVPAWAQTCPIEVEGYEAERYRK